MGFLGILYVREILHNKNKPSKIKDASIPIKDIIVKDKEKGNAYIYEAKNGTPEQNTKKVIEMIGGIENLIGKDDIVVLKPNAQWWNQGMTNTNALKAFIELVLAMPTFKGEIIIADNHQCYGPRNTCNIRGWTTNQRNGDFNYNELIEYFRQKGYCNVTKYHWISGGPFSKDENWKAKFLRPLKEIGKKLKNYKPRQIINHPREGDGYVWTNIEYEYNGRKTKMTYPIFTSSYSGVRIDFKNGAWQNSKYTGQPVKFINFAVLNHHSNFAGVTSAVKNYLGIVDMTCGYKGAKPEGYSNFHYMGIPGLGGAVGTFMNTIRKADLNIITAEWVGFASRIDVKLSTQTKTILASTDPVALDYYGAKYLLHPLGGPAVHLNNPDNMHGPFRKYLELCSEISGCVLNEKKMKIKKYDFVSSN